MSLTEFEINDRIKKYAWHTFAHDARVVLLFLSSFGLVCSSFWFLPSLIQKKVVLISIIGGIITFTIFVLIVIFLLKHTEKQNTPHGIRKLIKQGKYDEAYRIAKDGLLENPNSKVYHNTIIVIGHYIWHDNQQTKRLILDLVDRKGLEGITRASGYSYLNKCIYDIAKELDINIPKNTFDLNKLH